VRDVVADYSERSLTSALPPIADPSGDHLRGGVRAAAVTPASRCSTEKAGSRPCHARPSRWERRGFVPGIELTDYRRIPSRLGRTHAGRVLRRDRRRIRHRPAARAGRRAAAGRHVSPASSAHRAGPRAGASEPFGSSCVRPIMFASDAGRGRRAMCFLRGRSPSFSPISPGRRGCCVRTLRATRTR
jgi:hypothetical protein